ncbi:MAG TPA: AMP-binding protein, partial [Candidatus Solibacter sp.]|nr:AMP-binding protein [Candidatus Solibacter sp.]
MANNMNSRDTSAAGVGVLASPSSNILSAEERRQVLEGWNDTGRAVREATLPELVEAQVARTPKVLALVYEQEEYTYEELNRRANQLAHLLIREGIGPESIVAMALPRSVEMIVSLLGILKAGAAYLPLDPDYPAERLAFMIGDAEPACLVTVSSLIAQLPDSLPRLLVLDDLETESKLAAMVASNPVNAERVRPLRPSNPAYMIYTSGSTGTPKAVVMTNTGLVNLMRWHCFS